MSKDIVTRGNIGWNCNGPGVVVRNQGIRSEFTRSGATIKKSYSIDLEKLESSLIDSCTISVAVGKVVLGQLAVIQSYERE